MHKSLKTQANILASVFATGVVLLAGTLSVSAAEQSGVSSRTKQVSFADLNLSAPQGIAAARDRVLQTARKLCAQMKDDLDLSSHATFVKCVDNAIAGTMPHLDALIRKDSDVRTASLNGG